MSLQSKTPQELKKEYPTFPAINKKEDMVSNGKYISFESLIRLKKEGIYYLVLCRYKGFLPDGMNNIVGDRYFGTYNKFIEQVYQVQNFYRVSGKYDIEDDNQIEESERLTELNPLLMKINS